MNNTKRSISGLLAASVIVLAACGGSGGSASDPSTTGFFSLGISDGPIHEAKKVCISFEEIELFSSGISTIITFDPPETVNLLEFQGADFAPLIQSAEVDAGNYQWLRLGIDAEMGGTGGAGDTGGDGCDGTGSYIVMNDESQYNLYVPSGAETGLKLVSGITIPVGGAVDFTAEFDLMRSITAPPGANPMDADVVLRPVIRLVNNVEVGTLTGTVHSDLATAEACEPSVYVFNDGVTPNGFEDGVEDADDPIATAMVSQQENGDGSMTWNYTVGFLLGGDYEAAFTCNGTDFEPVDGLEAPITANETTSVDFEPPTE